MKFTFFCQQKTKKQKKCVNRYIEYQSLEAFVSQNLFRRVWESFVALQNWTCFSCIFCHRPGHIHESDKVIMDGICIGVQEYRCDTSINPKTIFKDESVNVEMGTFKRTRFTHDVATQKKLLSLVVTQTGNFKRDCKVPKFNARKAEKVLTWALSQPRYQSFANFMIWCHRIDQSKDIPES